MTNRKMTFFSICLGILCLGLPGRPVAAQPQTDMGPTALIAALADGPLQVRLAALPHDAVSAKAAAQAASQAIGIVFEVSHAWPVTFTDRENLSRPGTQIPCWLVASSQPFTLPLEDELAPKRPPRRETLYAVINARTGVLLEAFNRPRAAWWRRVVVTGEPLLREMNRDNQTAFPAPAPPGLPLAGLVSPSDASKPPHLAAFSGGHVRADQFIARYYVLTDLSFSVPTHLPTGPEEKFVFLHQPVWAISLEGLNTPIGGPMMLPAPPLPPHKSGTVPLARQEEMSTVINATTGENFGIMISRDGRQVDMF